MTTKQVPVLIQINPSGKCKVYQVLILNIDPVGACVRGKASKNNGYSSSSIDQNHFGREYTICSYQSPNTDYISRQSGTKQRGLLAGSGDAGTRLILLAEVYAMQYNPRSCKPRTHHDSTWYRI